VRADLFDAIDQSLRLNRKRWNTPFGGVKIVAFGDFYQLPPVVTDQDRDQMRNMGYTTEFFFSSRAFKQALQENQVAYHQFSTIFRQSDQMFIDVLNKVRAYTFDQEVATALNSRVIDQVEHAPKNSTILTTINRVANAHNNRELEKLPGAASSFTAEVTGKIADSEVPAVKELNLKVGAKVLFVKNNIPAWVNGSVGTVVQLPTSEPNESKPLLVRIDDKVVAVDRDVWEKKERKKVAGRMQDQVIGTFRQYPIKLGWAVTIHKSQGMTLPNAVIDTRVAAFAAGQVYVALSRCRSLDTLHLLSPITEEQILVDSRITTADAYIRRVSAKTKTEEIRRDARSALQEGRSPAQTASAFVVEHEPGVFTLSRSKIHKKPKGQKNREIER
jgi:ATP-dependent DNA helicase PIF1